MNKERYVSYEIAKLLKEKGFCEENIYCYYQGEYENDSTDVWRGECKFNWNIYDDSYSAPTQQMACRWLMEEKHIFIGKSFAKNEETLNLEFYSPIFNMDTCELITTIGAFCPEDAVEAALEYCLTNLI